MKKVLMLLVLTAISSSAMAVISYDQNVTPDVIFGSGNGNGYFAVDTNNGVELGLRAKIAYQGIYNSNGGGVYSFDTGTIWNVEWSINSDVNNDGSGGKKLSDYEYDVTISSMAKGILLTDLDVVYDGVWDHSFGNNSTPNGGGVETVDPSTYQGYISDYNVSQQSWRPNWFGVSPFDYNDNDNYYFTLSAYDGTDLVAQTSIEVIVGTGAVVPAPGAMLLAGIGTACVGRFRRRML